MNYQVIAAVVDNHVRNESAPFRYNRAIEHNLA
jgi:hypothetical protein